MKKLRVVVSGHDQKFWNPIQRVLEQCGRFEFREDLRQRHNEHVPEISKQCIEWADGSRAFYIRNLKDQRFYDPQRYDRAKIRADLGFNPEDRIILFDGLLRKHIGIHELVELLRRIGDDRYKILFVGSRISPEQKVLAANNVKHVTILPPQDRNYMAQVNYACDHVILWLDPKIPASHYQMPYKFTDAIAMQVPVITSDMSDLVDLIYDAAIRNGTVLPAAQDFVKFYSRFHESVAAASQEPVS